MQHFTGEDPPFRRFERKYIASEASLIIQHYQTISEETQRSLLPAFFNIIILFQYIIILLYK